MGGQRQHGFGNAAMPRAGYLFITPASVDPDPARATRACCTPLTRLSPRMRRARPRRLHRGAESPAADAPRACGCGGHSSPPQPHGRWAPGAHAAAELPPGWCPRSRGVLMAAALASGRGGVLCGAQGNAPGIKPEYFPSAVKGPTFQVGIIPSVLLGVII